MGDRSIRVHLLELYRLARKIQENGLSRRETTPEEYKISCIHI